MSLLSTVQAACDQMGIDRPSAVAASTDPGPRQLMALANTVGLKLARDYEWSMLTRETTITVTSGTDTYAFDGSLVRIIDDALWDATNRWPLIGPLNVQEWNLMKKGVVATGPRRRWRKIGKADGTYSGAATQSTYFQVDPIPTNSSDQLFYSWTTNKWAISTGGTAAAAYAADTDFALFDEEMIVRGLIAAWKRAKGLAYSQEQKDFEDYVQECFAQDKAARPLALNNRWMLGPRLIDWQNIPDTGYGS